MRWQAGVGGVMVVAAIGGGAWWASARRPPPGPPPEPVLPEVPPEEVEPTAVTGETAAGCTADTGFVGELPVAAPASGPDGAALEALDQAACGEPARAARPLVLTPARPVDALAWVWVDAVGTVTRAPILGELCQGAPGSARCGALASRPPPLDGFARSRGRRALLAWTSGEEVGFAATPAELLALLAPIDTPDEAALWLEAGVEEAAWQVPCLAAGARGTPEGLELFVRSGLCEDEREHRVLVRPDGGVVPRFAAAPVQPVQCRCGLETRPPRREDTFDAARVREERLAAAALSATGDEAWVAYLEAFPAGPRAQRARHALAVRLLERMAGEQDGLAWDTEIAASEGDAELTWNGRRAALQGLSLLSPSLQASGAGAVLSAELRNQGQEPLRSPVVVFDLWSADGRLVDQLRQSAADQVVPPGGSAVLTWSLEPGAFHPDASRAVGWIAGFR